VSEIEQARLRWIEERPQYEAFGVLIQGSVEKRLQPLGVWFAVSQRAKSVDSFVKKLLRDQKHTFENLPDKVGARVVVRYRADLDPVIVKLADGFDFKKRDDKASGLGTDKVGYQSIHLDEFRLRESDGAAQRFTPKVFWVELQVRTLAQHLWSEMTHDSFCKNDATMSELPVDVKRRVNLMSGQIEVADREFDRLNSEVPQQDAVQLWRILERHYYQLSSRRPDVELSFQVLGAFLPMVKPDLATFASQLNQFLDSKRNVLQSVYAEASQSGAEDTFLFQPEVLFLYDLLSSDPDKTRQIWNERYPELELERIANRFGISFD
jgi:ppGpp synthetase/RelA/SpoT-type nucleotidyltranferase